MRIQVSFENKKKSRLAHLKITYTDMKREATWQQSSTVQRFFTTSALVFVLETFPTEEALCGGVTGEAGLLVSTSCKHTTETTLEQEVAFCSPSRRRSTI